VKNVTKSKVDLRVQIKQNSIQNFLEFKRHKTIKVIPNKGDYQKEFNVDNAEP